MMTCTYQCSQAKDRNYPFLGFDSYDSFVHRRFRSWLREYKRIKIVGRERETHNQNDKNKNTNKFLNYWYIMKNKCNKGLELEIAT